MDTSLFDRYRDVLESNDWVLVGDQSASVADAFSIYNTRSGMLLLVEVESVHRELCSEMRRRGVPVLPKIPQREISIEDLPIEPS